MFVVPDTSSDRVKPENQFHFQIAGDDYALPKIQYIPIDVIETSQETGGVSLRALAELLGNVSAAKAVGTLDAIQGQALMKAWKEASVGVSLGESTAS